MFLILTDTGLNASQTTGEPRVDIAFLQNHINTASRLEVVLNGETIHKATFGEFVAWLQTKDVVVTPPEVENADLPTFDTWIQ